MSKRLIRLPEVLMRTGKGKTQLYADIKEGRFPSPVKIGSRAVAWDSDAVDRWIEQRISEAVSADEGA